MAGLLHDLRYAFRMLLKAPGFTAAAVLTLALAIGANSTIFSVISATILKNLPFPESERLVLLWKTYGTGEDRYNIVSAPNFWDWQRQSHSFEHVAVFDSAGKGYNLSAESGQREAEQVSGLRVSADYFAVLGVKPFLGREFHKEEETLGKDREVILSYGLWQRRYAGDVAIVGNTIRVDGEKYNVVGVMPRTFHFQFWGGERQLWVPAGWTEGDQGRGSNSFVAIARLKPGVSVPQANAEIATIQKGISQQATEDRDAGAAVMAMNNFGLDGVQATLLALLAAVAFVLLIGCVNVANLMLARGAERRREFAIRQALGASRGRIVRHLLAESCLLSLLGGGAGLLCAVWTTALLTRILPNYFSYLPFRPLDAITLDGRVLLFTLVVSTGAGILFGIAPAFTASRVEINEPMKEGGRTSSEGGRGRLRYVLVASEVGLTLVVLCGAGLMIQTMARLLAVDPGFDPKNLLVMSINLPQINTYYGPPVHARFCDDLEEHVGSLAGVVSVGAAAHLPMLGRAGRDFVIEGRPVPDEKDVPDALYTVACPHYFRTLATPLLKGREFTAQDTLGSTPVVVINEALAKKYLPDRDPVGQRIKMDWRDPKGAWMTVVGVVGNMRHEGLDTDAHPQLFRPYTQAAWPWMYIVARTASSPPGYANSIKKELASVEPDRPADSPLLLDDVVRGSEGSRRFVMVLLVSFATLALVLAAVGIVGVVAYSVTQRRHEIGIRIALGAQTRDVLSLVLTRSMTWVLAGVGAGLAGSLLLTRLLGGLLYGVKPSDPGVLAAVSLLLAAVALAASYAPARRATKVDPVSALRQE
jgi:putative ABC transport system permease protein